MRSKFLVNQTKLILFYHPDEFDSLLIREILKFIVVEEKRLRQLELAKIIFLFHPPFSINCTYYYWPAIIQSSKASLPWFPCAKKWG